MQAPDLEPRSPAGRQAARSPGDPGLQTPRSIADQKSIFLGNLPFEVTETELCEIFSPYGTILGCDLIRKPIIGAAYHVHRNEEYLLTCREGEKAFNVFAFIEFSEVAEADSAAQCEVNIRKQRIRVEPKEYSARRHTRLQPFGQAASVERPRRGIAWGPSANAYQSSAAMPFGFQPVYVQPPAFHPGYAYTTTPPSSGQRRRPETGDEYMYDGSSPTIQHYIPAGHPAYAAMAHFQHAEPEDYRPHSRRHR